MQDNVTTSSLPDSVRVVVVGTGALGSAVCRLLLERAQRTMLLIDPDRVEPRNVALSPLFRPEDIGRSKVEVIATMARARGLAWQALEAEIADVGLGVLREYDLLLSATDSALARVETAFAARSLRLPMLDAGVQSLGIAEGRVSFFAPAEDAGCYLCGLPEARRADLLAYALSASLGCRPPEATARMTGAAATVEATAEVLLGLPGLSRKQSFARRLSVGASGRVRAEQIELTRSPSCPWHALPSPDRLVSLPHDRSLAELLEPGAVLELGWPVCLRARCRSCGTVCEPMLRTAQVRRTLPCPGCGERGRLEPLASVQTLGRSHPLASRTLCELGLPERQFFQVRRSMFVGAG